MLSVNKLTSTSASIVDYTQNQEQRHVDRAGNEYVTGYYANGAPSAWGGELAAEYGLDGPVDTDTFQRLLDGQAPDGEQFADPDSHRRKGNDLTFSAPKSVSIEALAYGNDDFKEMHDRAVREAMEYVENNVISARYGKNGARSETTGNALFARFQHEDSRPVNGKIQPQLHDHVIVMNMTRGANDELRATDLDFGEQAVRMHTADWIYKASYAKQLEDAGYATRQTKNGFELAHVTDEQIRRFSDRTTQIDENLKKKG